jgi:hypothetical protein
MHQFIEQRLVQLVECPYSCFLGILVHKEEYNWPMGSSSVRRYFCSRRREAGSADNERVSPSVPSPMISPTGSRSHEARNLGSQAVPPHQLPGSAIDDFLHVPDDPFPRRGIVKPDARIRTRAFRLNALHRLEARGPVTRNAKRNRDIVDGSPVRKFIGY